MRALAVAVVRPCHEAGDWPALCEHVVLLSKRRAQVKAAVSDMVKEAMLYVEAQQDMDKKIKLIETLNDVTEGKIYVEIERARLVRQLVRIREGQGKIKEAADKWLPEGCELRKAPRMSRIAQQ